MTKNGSGEFVRLAVDGDLALAHGFEERGLGLRRRAVDFVGQDDVGEDGAGLEFEGTRALVVHVRAGDVRRQEVRVNWIRRKERSSAFAKERAVRVLPVPGTSSKQGRVRGRDARQHRFEERRRRR